MKDYESFDDVDYDVQIVKIPELKDMLDSDDSITKIAETNLHAKKNLILVAKAREFLSEMSILIEETKKKIIEKDPSLTLLRDQNIGLKILTDFTF